jgi:hypothetical protein
MRRVRHERQVAKLAANVLEKPLPCVVTLTRISAGTLDDDNNVGALKHCRDGIADAYQLPDNDPRFTWNYAQEKCPRGKFGVRIEIEGKGDEI